MESWQVKIIGYINYNFENTTQNFITKIQNSTTIRNLSR